MKAWCFFSIIFASTFFCVSSQNECPLADQPYKDDLVMEKIVGRWYLTYMVSSNDKDPRTGTVLDATRENGTTYLQITYLTPNGQCGNVVKMKVWHGEPGKYKLYAQEQKVADAVIIATNYHTYVADYYCTTVGKNGVCEVSSAHIWSRTPDLPAEAFNQAKRQLERACLAEHTYEYNGASYGDCPTEEDKKNHCSFKNIPFLSNLEPDRLLGRWYMKVWYHGDNGKPVAKIGATAVDLFKEDGKYFQINYALYQSKCLKLSSRPLYMTSEKGKLKQLGNFDEVVERYVVGTDYTSYLLEWLCRATSGDGVCVEPYVWLWSRFPTISKSSLNEAEKHLDVLCGHDKKIEFPSSEYEQCPPKEDQGNSKGAADNLRAGFGMNTVILAFYICLFFQ